MYNIILNREVNRMAHMNIRRANEDLTKKMNENIREKRILYEKVNRS